MGLSVQLVRYAARGDGMFGWLVANGFRCFTVERPWLQNMNDISAIPAGTYRMALEYSPKFGKPLWELKGVPGRSEAKIHAANRASELEGCIALGESITQDRNGWFVTHSTDTVKAFHVAMGTEREAEIVITDAPGPETRLATSSSPTGPE